MTAKTPSLIDTGIWVAPRLYNRSWSKIVMPSSFRPSFFSDNKNLKQKISEAYIHGLYSIDNGQIIEDISKPGAKLIIAAEIKLLPERHSNWHNIAIDQDMKYWWPLSDNPNKMLGMVLTTADLQLIQKEIVNYLELMVSRREDDNKDTYSRQKAVSTQLRGLAIASNTCLFTATQTNRSGNTVDGKSDETKTIDISKIAESYGKAMPMDYLISINQTVQEYEEAAKNNGLASARLYIAKNRNGQKFISFGIRINYHTMKIKEVIHA